MLNKTPTKLDDATELERSVNEELEAATHVATPKSDLLEKQIDSYKSHRLRRVILSVLLILLLAGAAYYYFLVWQVSYSQPLTAPKGEISVEVVDTPALRQQGLSGRNDLDDNAGMLFVFDTSSTQNCFWMKDMKFSIDMIWLDEQKRVVSVSEDVSPQTYPENFCPSAAAKYGLEVPSGQASALGIKTGEYLIF